MFGEGEKLFISSFFNPKKSIHLHFAILLNDSGVDLLFWLLRVAEAACSLFCFFRQLQRTGQTLTRLLWWVGAGQPAKVICSSVWLRPPVHVAKPWRRSGRASLQRGSDHKGGPWRLTLYVALLKARQEHMLGLFNFFNYFSLCIATFRPFSAPAFEVNV